MKHLLKALKREQHSWRPITLPIESHDDVRPQLRYQTGDVVLHFVERTVLPDTDVLGVTLQRWILERDGMALTPYLRQHDLRDAMRALQWAQRRVDRLVYPL